MQIITREVGSGSLAVDNPLVERLYLSRGIRRIEETQKGLQALLSPSGLTDVEKAAERLADALTTNQRILIVGDYDADGATSVALCKLALTAMGAEQVDFLVPDRFQFGYGLSLEIVALAQSKAPDLIVTVDNGISSLEGKRRQMSWYRRSDNRSPSTGFRAAACVRHCESQSARL